MGDGAGAVVAAVPDGAADVVEGLCGAGSAAHAASRQPSAAAATSGRARGTSGRYRYGPAVPMREPRAWWGGRVLSDPVETVDLATDPGALDRRTSGTWLVVVPFEGAGTAHRFATTERGALPPAGRWDGAPGPWSTSLDGPAYRHRVERDPRAGAPGRGLPGEPVPGADGAAVRRAGHVGPRARAPGGNPAPYAGVIATARRRLGGLGLTRAVPSPRGRHGPWARSRARDHRRELLDKDEPRT